MLIPPSPDDGGAMPIPPNPPADGGAAPDPTPGRKSDVVYPPDKIIELHLTFPPGAWDKLLATPGPDDYVPCSLSFEGASFPEAACRRKANRDYWRFEKKPQMIVRFNWFNKEGRFLGLRRLNLEAFYQQHAPVRDRLGMWVMREAGVDAPRVNHAKVFKDGALLGLYMNIESVDREFLEIHYGKAAADGNLWESAEDLKTNEMVNDQRRLMTLKQLVSREPMTGDHNAFFGQLDAMVDIEQVIREMAAETAALADDNFSNGGANYYLYDHPTRGFVVLPWDFDTMFVATVNADPFTFWDGAPPNKWRQLMDQNPTWHAQYIDALVQIRDQVLPRLPAEIDYVCSQVRAAFMQDPNRYATDAQFDADCRDLKDKVPMRIAALKRMLGR